jgi:hypothetical protein
MQSIQKAQGSISSTSEKKTALSDVNPAFLKQKEALLLLSRVAS